MKWMLVVLVAGITPVPTNLVFDKFTDCSRQKSRCGSPTLTCRSWDRAAI